VKPPDQFVARQTSNLQDLVRGARILHQPGALRTREEKDFLSAQSSPCRCIRCGNLVHPFVAMPGPYLCHLCEDELRCRDQQDVLGCRWWQGLLDAARARTKENHS
jgi:hypothetical protein